MSDIQTTVQDLITTLESQRNQILDEIRRYPPPIPACDAQFNYLLEKRDRLSVDLNRLHNLSQGDDLADELAQFISQSTVIHDDLKQRFCLSLQGSQE